jgi:kumamolisin
VNVPVDSHGRSGRAIPDVSVTASPQSGYRVFVGGQKLVVGGTVGSCALWAGLIALINQGLGHNVGYINPVLYTKLGPTHVLNNVTEGNNGVPGVPGYSAGPGWNAATGWGSPDGRKLFQAFQSLAANNR